MNWTNWLTLALAVLGATLGVFNAVWMIRRDTVRLKVTCWNSYPVAGGAPLRSVDVTNLSYLAVTVKEVALQKGRTTDRRTPIVGDYLGRTKLPRRLKPRSALTVVASPEYSVLFKGSGFTHVRVVTACGVEVISPIRRVRRWWGS
ncbi:hypothetical protein [Xylella fastidiosa]|uniref:Uncharacterized protein n=1 Tax=Xylella fastidiosa subsp. multiplex TaxID=644357 RepID=A0AAW6HWP1_XYLFS|nr:hypothetical protein [Xylella fastidiosa]MDC6408592.1 hypothetical protein [Xylella fastidiosa subsp. multiplex]